MRCVRYKSRTRIRFSNGSWIIALPCGRTGSTLRGYTAHLIIFDEAAFMPEEVITNVALPMLATTGGACWMLSTPWGQDHIFYRIWAGGGEWSKYHFPSSVNPLISAEFLEEQRQLIGDERFRIEYLAEFVEEGTSFFPMTLLRRCVGDFDLRPEYFTAGYDPGGKQSRAALVVVARAGEYFGVVFYKTWKSEDYTTINVEVGDICKKYNVSRLYVDMTGLGGPIIEHLKELNINVEGIVLTAAKKEELFTNLKLLLEREKIILPNAPELLNNLNAVVYSRLRSGHYSFDKRAGAYDDLAYALALACVKTLGFEFGIVKSR